MSNYCKEVIIMAEYIDLEVRLNAQEAMKMMLLFFILLENYVDLFYPYLIEHGDKEIGGVLLRFV